VSAGSVFRSTQRYKVCSLDVSKTPLDSCQFGFGKYIWKTYFRVCDDDTNSVVGFSRFIVSKIGWMYREWNVRTVVRALRSWPTWTVLATDQTYYSLDNMREQEQEIEVSRAGCVAAKTLLVILSSFHAFYK